MNRHKVTLRVSSEGELGLGRLVAMVVRDVNIAAEKLRTIHLGLSSA